jgi:methylmalonyl-CoA mutase C-terminal domain/subunit
MEVIYTGLHQTPDDVVKIAIQEDADAIGLSSLSGAHMPLFTRVLELLAGQQAADIAVFAGGVIPDDDIARLKELGILEVFTPGVPTAAIVRAFQQSTVLEARTAGEDVTEDAA